MVLVLNVLCVSSTRMGELRDLHGACHASTVLARGAVGDGSGILASASWVDLQNPFGHAPGPAIDTARCSVNPVALSTVFHKLLINRCVERGTLSLICEHQPVEIVTPTYLE